MVQRSRTPDEKFILMLYKRSQEKGELETPQDRYEIGHLLGLHPKAIDTICKTLLQTNFIKKEGDIDVYLTKNGERLALTLLED